MHTIILKYSVLMCVAFHSFATELSLNYTADFVNNQSGGISQNSAWVDSLTIAGEHRWRYSQYQVQSRISGIYANGKSISEYVGDVQAVSGLEAGARFARVYEAFVDICRDDTSVLIGIYDINSEFDLLDSANLFVAAAYGMGSTLGLSGGNGPSTFPYTGLSLRLQRQIDDSNTLRIVVSDGLPSDPDSPNSLGLNLSSDEGALLVAEWQHTTNSTKWLSGYWQYTKNTGSKITAGNGKTNRGVYVRTEHTLHSLKNTTVFARFGAADKSFNPFYRFLSAGFVVNGIVPSRADDQLGLAFAYAKNAGTYIDSFEAGMLNEDGELNVEATYLVRVNKHLALQPTLQYVRHPSGADIPNASILGIRFIIDL